MPNEKTEFEIQEEKRRALDEKKLLISAGDLGEFPPDKVLLLSLDGLGRVLARVQEKIETDRAACSRELIEKLLFQLTERVYSAHSYSDYKKALELSERAAWLRGANLQLHYAARMEKQYLTLLNDMKIGANWHLACYHAEHGAAMQDLLRHERGMYPHVGR